MRDKLKHLFIPHKGNNFKPNFLEKVSAGIILGLIITTFSLANIHALLWVGSNWLTSSVLPAVIVDLTNDERTDGSLGTLTRNEVLDHAAQLKADDMVKNDYFAHYSPEGKSPWYWFGKAGYEYIAAGENLAVHFTDSRTVVDAWMDSPGHRANILNGMYTEIGVGTAEGMYHGVPTVFVVQLFGSPLRVQTLSKKDTQPPPPVQAVAIETTTPAELASTDQIEQNPVAEVLPNSVTQESSEHPQALYSDFATTTRDATDVQKFSYSGGITTPEASLITRSGVEPGLWLSIIYGLLASIVTLALTFSIVIEWRKQHPVHIMYAGGLLAVMATLLYVHTALTSGVIII